MKKVKALLIALVCMALVGCSSQPKETGVQTEGKKKIGVIQLTEHTSLNMIYDSFVEELDNLGYTYKVTIDFKNAQNEMSNIPSIVQYFDANKQDVVVTITTPVAQGAMALTKNTPVVFAAVTDPIAAKVVTDLEKPEGNITGTSDMVQIDEIIDLALTIQPDIKTMGFIYNPSETNSVSNYERFQAACNDRNIKMEVTSISTSIDLQTATSALLPKVDAIFVPNDNTVAEAMPVLAKLAKDAKVPVYTGADSMVMDGGFATIGIDYVALGKKTAEIAVQVLEGTPTSEIPVYVFKDDLYITINEGTMNELGLTLPSEIANNEKLVLVK
jgi:putative tryptophan/tyrosine transport system substrate-binding protein